MTHLGTLDTMPGSQETGGLETKGTSWGPKLDKGVGPLGGALRTADPSLCSPTPPPLSYLVFVLGLFLLSCQSVSSHSPPQKRTL